MSDAYDRVVVGHYSDGRDMVINQRTELMLDAADGKLSFPFRLSQGSYNTAVAASGGTHAGGGVVDVSVSDLTSTQENQLLSVFRSIGFYAWLRTPDQGDWPYHIHAVAKGDAELSSSATQQTIDAEAGYNGLRSHLYDGLNLDVPTFDYEGYVMTILSAIADAKASINANVDAVVSDLLARPVNVGGVNHSVYSCLSEASYANDANAAVVALRAKVDDLVDDLLAAPVDTGASGIKSVYGTLAEASLANDAYAATQGLAGTVNDLTGLLNALTSKVDQLTAKVDALPKA
jgi:hypothetical protein